MKRLVPNVSFAAVTLAALLLTGCGGDEEEDGVEVMFTTAELDDMVLLKEELGSDYDHLRFDPQASGVIANGHIDELLLDDQTRAAIEEAIQESRRLTGYIQAYNYQVPTPVNEGPVYIYSGVDLFESADGAHAFFQDLETNPTQPQISDEGDEFRDLVRFEVSGIGDRAYGETGTVEYSLAGEGAARVTVYATRVIFQRGLLTGIVSVDRADQRDIKAHVIELARMLDEKHVAALASKGQ